MSVIRGDDARRPSARRSGTLAPGSAHSTGWRRLARFVIGESDPNDQRLQGRARRGPLRDSRCRRARDDAAAHASGFWPPCASTDCSVEFDALATRVLFDADKRAIGVEYLKGKNLYRASPHASRRGRRAAMPSAAREVILAGGAFNTPQLLMLSGIGPPDQLAALGIKVEVPLEGVGRNLQDRYEVGVVHNASRPWACLQGARFSDRRSDLPRMAHRPRHVHFERRGGRVCPAVERAPGKPGFVRHGAADAFFGLFSRLFGRYPQQS